MLLYSSEKKLNLGNNKKIFDLIERDENFSFSRHTTYGLGGGAKAAYFPKNLFEAKVVYECLRAEGERIFVLGEGSDILASDDGFDGSVICTKKMNGVFRVSQNKIFCLSGTTTGQLLSYCIAHGLGGLEYLAGIPATLGGLCCMNGGAGGVYISSNIFSVKLYDGKEHNLLNENCKFSYKHSTMRDIKALILGVFLSVLPNSPQNILKKVRQRLDGRSALPRGKSCGCVFKNILQDGQFISAGKTIEECGLSGYGSERAFVSPQHCNFIINCGATSSEICEIIAHVKAVVMKCRGITLEEEVIYVGKF